jgi:hypothetical protein
MAIIGHVMGGGLAVLGGVVLGSGPPTAALGPGLLITASGVGLIIASTFRSFGDMRRAIGHAQLSVRQAWRLWRRIRAVRGSVDKKLPDTERAQAIAALLVEGE